MLTASVIIFVFFNANFVVITEHIRPNICRIHELMQHELHKAENVPDNSGNALCFNLLQL